MPDPCICAASGRLSTSIPALLLPLSPALQAHLLPPLHYHLPAHFSLSYLTSPLLSTENKFLKKDSLLFPHSYPLFSSTLAPSTHDLPPTCSLPPLVLNAEERVGGEGRIRHSLPLRTRCLTMEEMTVVYGTIHPFHSDFL